MAAGTTRSLAAEPSLRSINLFARLRNEEADSPAGRLRIDQSEAVNATTNLHPFSGEPGILNWTSLPIAQQRAMPVSWTVDQAISTDRAFLPKLAKVAPFSLTPRVLSAWSAANAIPVNTPLVLFGIRGAAVKVETADWTQAVDIAPTTPDHINNRCLLGIWNVKSGRLVVYTGSTVPNVNWMYEQVRNAPNSCNMLPTGQYLYKSGPHLRYPGCFRLDETVYTRRVYKQLVYTVKDWGADVDNPANNIHLGFFDLSKTPAFFSSAGCQTIRGGWSSTDWAYARSFEAFRVAAGQSSSIPRGDVVLPSDNQRFVYTLVDYADLMLTSIGVATEARRHGSVGNDVTELRQKLSTVVSASRVDSGDGSRFDGKLTRLLVRWQQQTGRTSTGRPDSG